MGRILKVAGILALLAWTGLGLAAWLLVKDRLQITIADGGEAARRGDSRIDVLSGQVENLQTDLGALTDGLNQSLQGLADFVVEADADQSRALEASLAARVSALEEAIRSNGAEWSAVLADLKTVPPQQAAVPSPSEPPPSVTPTPEIIAASDGTKPTAPESEATPPREARVAAVDEKPKRRGFLAIELPSRAFAFDAVQAWEVVPSLSRVGFDAKSTLHDFTGVTSEVSGRFETNLAHPDRGITGKVQCAAAGLTTGLDDRDDNMGEHLAIDEHAEIDFTARSFEIGSADSETRTVTGTVKGDMTIRGVTRELAMPVTMAVDKSLRLGIEGEARLKMSDYSVPVPNQLGVVAVEDEVSVWINLKLRAKASGK